MFPIVIKKEGVKLPDKGTYYVITADGIFLRKDTGLIEAMVPVTQISFLKNIRPWAKHRFPKIPVKIAAMAYAFFRAVFEREKSEVGLVLYYSTKKKKYQLVCPPQKVSDWRVKYFGVKPMAGYQKVGTIHSHALFVAGHSYIDKIDEESFDGLHIVFGNINEPFFSLSVSIMVNGSRFVIKPESFIEGIKKVEMIQPVDLTEEENDDFPKEIIGDLDPFVASLLEQCHAVLEIQPEYSEEQAKEIVSPKPVLQKVVHKKSRDVRYRFARDVSVKFPLAWLKSVADLTREDTQSGKVIVFDHRPKTILIKFQKEEKDGGISENKSNRNRRYRLCSFPLFGQIFTISVEGR